MKEDPSLFKENMKFIQTARRLIEQEQGVQYMKENFEKVDLNKNQKE